MKSSKKYFGKVLDHEILGIDLLYKEVPVDNFHLLVSTNVSSSTTTREIDITMVCPYGIFAIELKHWYGTMREPLAINPVNFTIISSDNTVRKFPNPIKTADKQRKIIGQEIVTKLDPIADQKLIGKLNSIQVKGVVFFTCEDFRYVIKDIGNVACINPSNISSLWANKKEALSEEEIARILSLYEGGEFAGPEGASQFSQGQIVGDYRIDYYLYETEAYKLYKATSELLQQEYFLKAVRLDPGQTGDALRIVQEVGKRDIQAKVKLKGEPFVLLTHIPPFADGLYIISVTEWVEHKTLTEVMEYSMTLPERHAIIKTLVNIYDRLLEREVVHRDLNPKNIIQTLDSNWKIINFDFAKLEGKQTVLQEVAGKGDVYRAPELVYYQPGATVDYRVDLYSLGVIFYELLTGQLPISPLSNHTAQNTGLSQELIDAIVLLTHNVPVRRNEGFALLKRWLYEVL